MVRIELGPAEFEQVVNGLRVEVIRSVEFAGYKYSS